MTMMMFYLTGALGLECTLWGTAVVVHVIGNMALDTQKSAWLFCLFFYVFLWVGTECVTLLISIFWNIIQELCTIYIKNFKCKRGNAVDR